MFVGRPSTSESDVSEFLDESGITVRSCKMLEKRQDWQTKYAAFRVVLDYNDRDKFLMKYCGH